MAFNANGTPQRWRINGRCRTWKRKPDEFELPIKRGLRQFDYLTPSNAHRFHLTELEAYEAHYKELGYSEEDAALLAKGAEIHTSTDSPAVFCKRLVQGGYITDNEHLLQLLQEFYHLTIEEARTLAIRYGIPV